jgi:Protein of unknown function (DUF3108)
MRTLTRILLLVLAAALTPALVAQQASISPPPKPAIEPPDAGYVYPTQTLRYEAEWRLWKAGTATLSIQPGVGDIEHVIGTAESSGAVSVLYRVQDRIESYFDRRTDCSYRIVKHSEEGFHKRETSLIFDAAHDKSVLDERNLRNGETKHQETDSPACVTDVLSGIFYLGGQHLEPGMVHLFPLNDGGKTVAVTAYAEGREDVKTDAGLFHTVRVVIDSRDGALKGRGKVWVWYTDDAAHLPVQMRSHLFWGTMTLRLTRVENPPHPSGLTQAGK